MENIRSNVRQDFNVPSAIVIVVRINVTNVDNFIFKLKMKRVKLSPKADFIQRLPSDLEFHVYSFVSVYSLPHLTLVSKAHYERIKAYLKQVKDLVFWEKENEVPHELNMTMAKLLHNFCGSIRSMTMSSQDFPARWMQLVEKHAASLKGFSILCGKHGQYCKKQQHDHRLARFPIGTSDLYKLAQCHHLETLQLHQLWIAMSDSMLCTKIQEICQSNLELSICNVELKGYDQSEYKLDLTIDVSSCHQLSTLQRYPLSNPNRLGALTNLQRLHVEVEWAHIEAVTQCMDQLPQLTHLNIDYLFTKLQADERKQRTKTTTKTIALQSQTLTHFALFFDVNAYWSKRRIVDINWTGAPNIECVELQDGINLAYPVVTHIDKLLQCAQHIVTVKNACKYIPTWADDGIKPFKIFPTSRTLRNLYLETTSHFLLESDLPGLAQCAPRLETLHLWVCKQMHSSRHILTALSMLASTLRSISLHTYNMTATYNSAVLDKITTEAKEWPYLTSLTLCNFASLPRTLEAMIDKCPVLQHLHLEQDQDELCGVDMAISMETVGRLAEQANELHIQGNFTGESTVAMRYLHKLVYRDLDLQYGPPFLRVLFCGTCLTECKQGYCECLDPNPMRRVEWDYKCRNCHGMASRCNCDTQFKKPTTDMRIARQIKEEAKLLRLLQLIPNLQQLTITSTDVSEHFLRNVKFILPSSLTKFVLLENDVDVCTGYRSKPDYVLDLILAKPNLRTILLPNGEMCKRAELETFQDAAGKALDESRKKHLRVRPSFLVNGIDWW